MEAFMNAQLGYSLPVRICYYRSMRRKINYLHEKALRSAYGGRKSTFEELLSRDNSVNVYFKNFFKYLMVKCTNYKMELSMAL